MAIFGARSNSSVIPLIEKALGVTFEAHESYYIGEYDFAVLRRPLTGDVEIELRPNEDPLWLPEDPPEEQFADSRFPNESHLLYVNTADEEIIQTLKGCGLVLLYRENV